MSWGNSGTLGIWDGFSSWNRLTDDQKQRRRKQRKVALGQVYFIQQGSDGPIKIGFTTNIEQRLKNLQTGSPFPLALLVCVPGSEANEATLHRALKNHHLQLEWFANSREVLFIIEHFRQTGRYSDPYEVLGLVDIIRD